MVAVGPFESGVSEDTLPDVLHRLDDCIAATVGLDTPTSLPAA